ncbi:N-acetyltransferase [Drechslerella dactyloides]|uniref:N-acetyltransferase n=1 Tax=Drechslerella dactyloides TaxID=74499 RepID=A0AAD6J3A9_DREDA|nr:N-acetyltransferase [Drechslerella dactyloides]
MSPAALDDPTAPRKHLSGPARVNYTPEKVLPIPATLKDGTKVRVTPYINGYHEPPARGVVDLLCEEMNGEIEAGDTYPMDEEMDAVTFEGYWFGSFAGVVTVEASDEVVGSFHVKPNYPGRCSHVCNGAFLTVKTARGKGVGGVMADAFLVYAPLLDW